MTAPGKKPVLVRQVFAEDLEREFALIRSAIDKYPFVSMDTEFPGTIFKQDKNLIHQADPAINYLFMKSNVDALRIIQLGLTLADSQGVSHQAGSDSLLTLQCLMELKQSKVFDRINNDRMLPALALYGLVTVLG
ncbi:PREDICTED: probable CCR4-associated factor 1 homolog 11 [Theobroma cacao]|uniref:poly(A)-specific ribonuclease n=1 Tax=Theobroma cacao TaxID=3641 RepID=A0AB32VW04_THECC|nr:PREDICTED: probable CCR4-associated factor 1 homolog 11 [Theobroma cacao]